MCIIATASRWLLLLLLNQMLNFKKTVALSVHLPQFRFLHFVHNPMLGAGGFSVVFVFISGPEIIIPHPASTGSKHDVAYAPLLSLSGPPDPCP